MVNHSPQLFQRPLPAPAYRLLVVGDSQAAGVGTSSPEHSISGLFAAAHPDWSVETIARSGARIGEVTRMLGSAHPPYNLVLVFAGANDLIQMRPHFLIHRRLQELIHAARSLAPQIAISHGGNLGLAPAFPGFLASLYTRRARAARDYCRDLARTDGIIYLDFFAESPSGRPTHSADGLHLNDLGYYHSFQRILQILDDTGIKLTT